MKKILITGSSGVIGTRLCEKLLKNNLDIVCVDIRPNKWNKKINNLTKIIDLRNKDQILDHLPKNIELIIHLAAHSRVHDLIKNPVLAKENIDITFNVLEFMRANDKKKIIFSSSREIYGSIKGKSCSEQTPYIKMCENTYSASKISSEVLIKAYEKCHGINSIITRFSNVYGMYDEHDRIIPILIKKCLKNEKITIFGKDKVLDFVYIDDIINGIISIIKDFDNLKNDFFNIASGEGVSLINLAKKMKEICNSKNEIFLEENRTGETMKFIANIDKAKEKIGYNPKHDINKGLEKTITWYKNNI